MKPCWNATTRNNQVQAQHALDTVFLRDDPANAVLQVKLFQQRVHQPALVLLLPVVRLLRIDNAPNHHQVDQRTQPRVRPVPRHQSCTDTIEGLQYNNISITTPTSQVFDVIQARHGEENGLGGVDQVAHCHVVVGPVEQLLCTRYGIWSCTHHSQPDLEVLVQAGEAALGVAEAKVDVGVGTRGDNVELGVVDADSLRWMRCADIPTHDTLSCVHDDVYLRHASTIQSTSA